MTEEMLIGFFLGYVACMISDVIFSITNFFIQRAYKERAIRKAVEKGEDHVR